MIVILGLGYSGTVFRDLAKATGHEVIAVRRTGSPGILAFDSPEVASAVLSASHIISSVPPDASTGADPVLQRFGEALARTSAWRGYLSSTGVYGDTGGAFVDEASPVGAGRRSARTAADLAWQAAGATIFRLPGIYGPGRSALDQVRQSSARRIDRPGHRFNRIHVDDIAGALLAAVEAGATGIFNVVDDLPAEPRAVTEAACGLLGAPLPPLQPLDEVTLSPMARGFWSERRCVAGGRLTRLLGYRLKHPEYKMGLKAILEMETGR